MILLKEKSNKELDTIALVDVTKSVVIIREKEKAEEKGSDWQASLLFPLLVAIGIGLLTYYLNRKKTSGEINKSRSDRKKTDAEIEKLKLENDHIKKTFQPIVISTLQAIQDKIAPEKITALKELVKIKNDFLSHEQQYCEGDPIVPDYEDFLDLVFLNFGFINYDVYKKFHDTYSYLFPDSVFEILQNLENKISRLHETKKSFNSIGDPDLEPSQNDRGDIKEIIKLFEDAILAIRKDCHLDTSLIHDFIAANQ